MYPFFAKRNMIMHMKFTLKYLSLCFNMNWYNTFDQFVIWDNEIDLCRNTNCH